jgi:hypothetical protein
LSDLTTPKLSKNARIQRSFDLTLSFGEGRGEVSPPIHPIIIPTITHILVQVLRTDRERPVLYFYKILRGICRATIGFVTQLSALVKIVKAVGRA